LSWPTLAFEALLLSGYAYLRGLSPFVGLAALALVLAPTARAALTHPDAVAQAIAALLARQLEGRVRQGLHWVRPS